MANLSGNIISMARPTNNLPVNINTIGRLRGGFVIQFTAGPDALDVEISDREAHDLKTALEAMHEYTTIRGVDL